MRSFAQRTKHPWLLLKIATSSGTAILDIMIGRPLREKKKRGKNWKEALAFKSSSEGQNPVDGGQGTTDSIKATFTVITLSSGTSVGANQSQSHSNFFSKLPVELRYQIYADLIAGYPDTIHILAGDEDVYSSCTLLHMPCITPPDLEVPAYWIFDKWCWTTGPGFVMAFCVNIMRNHRQNRTAQTRKFSRQQRKFKASHLFSRHC